MYNTGYPCQILMKLEFSQHSFGKSSNINFMKILILEAEMFHADRRIDKTKLIVAFRNYARAPKSVLYL
jgi:hypothetical protein